MFFILRLFTIAHAAYAAIGELTRAGANTLFDRFQVAFGRRTGLCRSSRLPVQRGHEGWMDCPGDRRSGADLLSGAGG
jgi:hypothetical protein